MKDANDKTTIDIFQTEKRRGRPVTGTAKTNAERMRLYRKNRKDQGVRVIIQRPVDMEEIRQVVDDENNLYREIDILTQERDRALTLVAELKADNEALKIERKQLNDYNHDLLKAIKQHEINFKVQGTKLRNALQKSKGK